MRGIKKIAIFLIILVAGLIIAILWVTPDGATKEVIELTNSSNNNLVIIEKETKPQQETTIQKEELIFKSVDEAKAYVKKYAKKNGYKLEDYPEKLFELMVKDKNSVDFVLDYPGEINKNHDSTLELDSFDSVPLLIQWDTRWGYHQFKNGVVAIDGCGATCVSMIAICLNKDVTLTPDKVADYVSKSGYFVDGSGTSWSMFESGIKHYGLKSRGVSINENELIEVVESGHPVIASVGKGDFTKKGHYIVIAGYEKGKFIINDPFSEVNSAKRWSWNRIKPQIKTMWEFYK